MDESIANRSNEPIDADDLKRIRDTALKELTTVFARAEVAGLYSNRMMLLVLCQGSGKHFLDPAYGLKDIDVWAFFEAGPEKPFPHRSIWNADFGPSKFGRHPEDVGYSGRRMDIQGRSILRHANGSAEDSLQAWLRGGTTSATHIAKRPVIGLAPAPYLARVLWLPPSSATI
ncbi:hypothetical protein [Roseomonas sp. WA12]